MWTHQLLSHSNFDTSGSRDKVAILNGECIQTDGEATSTLLPPLAPHLTVELLPEFLGGTAATPAGCSAAEVPMGLMGQLEESKLSS